MRLIAEIRSLVKLALPVSMAQLSTVGMSATDVIVAGMAGTKELAGMNLGVNIWHMLLLFFLGVGIATQPLVARAFGEKSRTQVIHQLHQSIWLCLALALTCTLLIWFAALAIIYLPYESDLTSVASDFLWVIGFCALPALIIPALRGTLEGINRVKPVFFIIFAGFLINIPLDIILVFGYFGVPKLGAVGCAVATVVIHYLVLIGLYYCVKNTNYFASRPAFRDFESPHFATIKKTFLLGWPIGLSIIVEVSMFAGAGIMIAYFGAVHAGAHALAIAVASCSFMLYQGLGQAITIRASQLIGSRRIQRAWYTIFVGTGFNFLLALLLGVVLYYLRTPILAALNNDSEVLSI